jgi:hypothetical protein
MGPIVARVAFWIMFLLIFAEVILAWQFGHYSSVEGTAAQAASGWRLPLTIAIIAGFVFLIGATVLVHDSRTGDFLGFVPDGMRSWFERRLGVPEPPAGENSRWDLERQRWLPDFVGNETWFAGMLAIAAIVLVFFTYRAEAPHVHPAYKIILGGLRILLILMAMSVLLPAIQLRFDRQGWPDIVVLIDDSRSMGEPDNFQDEKIRERAKKLGEAIKKRVLDTLPEKIKALQAELALKGKGADNAEGRPDLEILQQRLQFWQNQVATVNSTAWKPTRLQLAQGLIANP